MDTSYYYGLDDDLFEFGEQMEYTDDLYSSHTPGVYSDVLHSPAGEHNKHSLHSPEEYKNSHFLREEYGKSRHTPGDCKLYSLQTREQYRNSHPSPGDCDYFLLNTGEYKHSLHSPGEYTNSLHSLSSPGDYTDSLHSPTSTGSDIENHYDLHPHKCLPVALDGADPNTLLPGIPSAHPHPHLHPHPHPLAALEAAGKPPAVPVKRLGQRRAANLRERRRMKSINDAFETLRTCIPGEVPTDRKLSKVDTLKLAMTYINFLSDLLQTCDDYPGHGPDAGQKGGLQEKIIVRCHASLAEQGGEDQAVMGHSLSWDKTTSRRPRPDCKIVAKLWVPESPTESDLVHLASYSCV